MSASGERQQKRARSVATQTRLVDDPEWYKDALIYELHVRAFADSNGDGIGDLPGIYSKLDYIKTLGVDIVWVCPIYKSPQVDMGYDISDYKDIHAPYGTVQDVDRIIEGCHQRGMKFVMDLVVNHTSDQVGFHDLSRDGWVSSWRRGVSADL